MKHRIAIVGAFDRNNYGDILMPIIFTKYFNNKYKDIIYKYDFQYYALKKVNMKKYKGFNSKPLYEIYKEKNIDYVIVIGGDTLPCRYGNMYIHLINDSKMVKKYQFLDRYFRPFFEFYAKKKLRCLHIRPWILDLKEYNIKTLYNTIGGELTNRRMLFQKKKIKKALQNSEYISVRDKGTKRHLDKLKVKNTMYPDSVVLLSKCIKDDDYKVNVSSSIKSMVTLAKKYIVLQISEKASEGEINSIANQIETLYNKEKLNCILLPIGRASGHSDQIPLKKIKELVKTPVFMPKSNNIYETAYIIKNSLFYCGTSLHGVITSVSYCIPHMALTNKVTKVTRFIETWNTSNITYTNSDEIYKNYIKLKSDKKLLQNLEINKKKLIKLCEENFRNIYNIIK